MAPKGRNGLSSEATLRTAERGDALSPKVRDPSVRATKHATDVGARANPLPFIWCADLRPSRHAEQTDPVAPVEIAPDLGRSEALGLPDGGDGLGLGRPVLKD